MDKIVQHLTDAAFDLRVLARLSKLKNKPYKNLLNLSEKLNKIVEVINYERNNQA